MVFSENYIKEEIRNSQKAMHTEFSNSQREPIFAPEKLKKFCTENGAPTIFETLLAAMTDDCHSENELKVTGKESSR